MQRDRERHTQKDRCSQRDRERHTRETQRETDRLTEIGTDREKKRERLGGRLIDRYNVCVKECRAFTGQRDRWV